MTFCLYSFCILRRLLKYNIAVESQSERLITCWIPNKDASQHVSSQTGSDCTPHEKKSNQRKQLKTIFFILFDCISTQNSLQRCNIASFTSKISNTMNWPRTTASVHKSSSHAHDPFILEFLQVILDDVSGFLGGTKSFFKQPIKFLNEAKLCTWHTFKYQGNNGYVPPEGAA